MGLCVVANATAAIAVGTVILVTSSIGEAQACLPANNDAARVLNEFANQLKAATVQYKEGNLAASHYWALLDIESRRIRRRLPTEAGTVDCLVRKIVGTNPFTDHARAPPQVPSEPVERLPKATVPALPHWNLRNAPKVPHVFHRTITPQELFKNVNRSIYVVIANIASSEQGVSQGSAVAVSKHDAVTNCHVVEKSKSIALINEATKLQAVISAADRLSDRCYLTVPQGELVPIGGLRDFPDLSIGETIYTVGAPRGLDKTLGQGLISGLRQDRGLKLIQISAPISRGSSGGGLFDDRGNLIGITTFALRDSRESQLRNRCVGILEIATSISRNFCQ